MPLRHLVVDMNSFTFIATRQRHAIDPYAYLYDALTRPPATPAGQIEQLVPRRWIAPATSKIIPAV